MFAKVNCRNVLGLTLVAQITLFGFLSAASVSEQTGSNSNSNNVLAALESPALKMISDEDQANWQLIKYQIANDFSDFKTVNEVHTFLDKVKLLVQKHPKNVAFAQGDLKELLKFLSLESVTRLVRLDTEPFVMPIGDEKMPLAQRALDDDELARKLFGIPIRSLVESRRQQLSRAEDGNHKDGNFFTNFWCKISGGCQNQ